MPAAAPRDQRGRGRSFPTEARPDQSGLRIATVPRMPIEAAVRAEGACLVLRVERYESPARTTGMDANWLVGRVALDVGRTDIFTAKVEVSVLASELESFRDELQVLDRELTGEATLHHLESQIGVTITLKSGKGAIAGYVREHIGATLRFDQIPIDQSYVREALEQFDALVTAFPVRGDPTG